MSYLSELQKLYPTFKIPYEKEADYYIGLLLEGNPELGVDLKNVQDFRNQVGEENMSKVKMKLFDEVLEFFKLNGWDTSKVDHKQFDCNFKEINSSLYKEKIPTSFISIDLKEANWQAFKHIFNLKELDSFSEFLIKWHGAHPAIANSKSFRQFIFGNTNPKLLQKVQRKMITEIEKKLTIELGSLPLIVRKSDELILPGWHFAGVSTDINAPYDVRRSFYTTEMTSNFGETVRIKTIIKAVNESKRKLQEVPGNRFFIHYKTLILGMELDERDFYFKNDGKLAKWIL